MSDGMIQWMIQWCRKQQKRLELEGQTYTAKLFGLMAAYYEEVSK